MAGLRGRPAKPTATKILQGKQKSKLPKNEPKPQRGIPPMPRNMPNEAQAKWKDLADVLDRMGVLTLADELSLKMLCETYSDYLDARRQLNQEGMFYTTVNNQGSELIRANPCMAIIAECDRRIRAWLVEFGLTPASRVRVKAEDPKEVNEVTTAESYFQ